jgi:hypothetical protein
MHQQQVDGSVDALLFGAWEVGLVDQGMMDVALQIGGIHPLATVVTQAVTRFPHLSLEGFHDTRRG